MAFFRKPQQPKQSGTREQARAGREALAEERRSLFSFLKRSKKQTEPVVVSRKEQTEHTGEAPSRTTPTSFGAASEVILRPRIAEKATDISTKYNAYVFDVLPRATKQQIAAGVKELYGVSPKRIRVVQVASKRVRGRRGEGGVKSGGKKAYVYLNKGDSIEFV